MFFERACPICSRPARRVCEPCWRLMRPLEEERVVPGVDRVVSLFSYDDAARRLVVGAKNGARRDVLRQLGRRMGAELERGVLGRIDVVTWVPASPALRRQRGFDQGRVLARAVGPRLRLPVSRLLVRRGDPQRGRGRAARLAGPILSARGAVPSSVLLVDDVATTGASLKSAAAVLRAAGATRVVGVTIASVHAAEMAATPIYR